VDFGFMVSVLPRLLPAFGVTIAVSVLALVAATVLGVLVGAVRSLISNRNPFAWIIDAQVALVRGTPIIVQIFGAYFLLPEVGVRLPPFWIGAIALTFNSLGYQSEIARAAIQSIGPGQYDAAAALGLSRWSTLRLVIVPQAARRMMPGLVNEASQLIKASSVLSVIAVFELHKATGAIVANTFKYVELLTLEALLYLALVSALGMAAERLQRRGLGATAGDAYQVR
jgi:polar amino acid transport system permease protein